MVALFFSLISFCLQVTLVTNRLKLHFLKNTYRSERRVFKPRLTEEPQAKRRRITRKLVAWLFVERLTDQTGKPTGKGLCRLGCLAASGTERLTYAAPSTTHVERHLEAKHPTMLANFVKAQNNEQHVYQLEKEVDEANAKALQRIEKKVNDGNKFFRFVERGLEHKTQCDLELLLWAIANGVSRSPLNCPILDLFLRHSGATPAPNRHDLAELHLPRLDNLVKIEYLNNLKKVRAVSIFSDGWSDRLRCYWIDLGLCYVDDTEPGPWRLETIDLDIIPIPGTVNGDVIETAIKESIEEFVPSDCLIATSTNDGAGDERKAAFQLVQDGNDWYCVAHRVQLAEGDCFDPKKAHPPEDCAPFRGLVKKSHDLVVFVNGHRIAAQRFAELSERKRQVCFLFFDRFSLFSFF